MTKPILYSFWTSGSSWRVRIALHIKGIPFEYRSVNIRKKSGGEQHEQNYIKTNPMKQVPTLIVDDHVLSQSLSIIEFLEEMYPQPRLLPSNLCEELDVPSNEVFDTWFR
jgi:maleylacetoacetate isomerase